MGINKKSCEKLAENGGSAMMRDLAPGFEAGNVGNCENKLKGRGNNNGPANHTASSTRTFVDVAPPPIE